VVALSPMLMVAVKGMPSVLLFGCRPICSISLLLHADNIRAQAAIVNIFVVFIVFYSLNDVH
jgi:hypothetical protein